jgi:hypothetical protein
VLDPRRVREIDGREMITLRAARCRSARCRLFEPPPAWRATASRPRVGARGLDAGVRSNQKSRWGSRARREVRTLAPVHRRHERGLAEARHRRGVARRRAGRRHQGARPSLKGVRGFAGATELGDQRIALVLDVQALVEETPRQQRAARLRAEEHPWLTTSARAGAQPGAARRSCRIAGRAPSTSRSASRGTCTPLRSSLMPRDLEAAAAHAGARARRSR